MGGSPRDKHLYLKNLVIAHRNLNSVLAEVQELMEEDAGLAIIVVVGPTGVGKSSFGRKQLREILTK
ncbi:flagellar biosynthesis GTPase FlhF [Paraburkholderia youngii]